MGDACGGLTDWNPLAAAPVNSQLAGVLASFVFAGIVLLLSVTQRGGEQSEYAEPSGRSRALGLFVASLMAFMMASFMFGLASGDQVCPRGWTVSMIAAGLMTLGILSLFGGLCWLIARHDHQAHRVTRIMLVATYFISLIMVFYTWATATKYLEYAVGSQARRWMLTWVSVQSWTLAATATLLFAGPLICQYRSTSRRESSESAVGVAAYINIAGVVVACLSVAMITFVDFGRPVSPGFFATMTFISLATVSAALVAQISVLPNGTSTRT